jgi:putative peptide zinc metalloprotease protein
MENTHENGLWMDIQETEATTPEEEPQGLWGLLQEKADQNLPSPCREGTREGDGLWQSLQQRLDLSRRRPKRIAEYELAHLGVGSDHEYYVLKNPAAHTYVRCTPQDFFLWEMMDGQHNVRDLAVAYFAKFGSFPFERLINLIGLLGEAGFLEKKPVQVFDALSQRFEGHSWAQRLNRWANVFMYHEFRVRRPDVFFDVLYRRGGWVLICKTAQILYIPLALAGLTLFLFCLGNVSSKTWEYYTLWKSYELNVWLLLLISYLVIPFHECAHALACKYYGREVLGAGAMFYYGAPAFFVDTSDMWLAPKRARIVTSWAGPFSSILIASVCSIAAAVAAPPPDLLVRKYLFSAASICYLSALMNLNPLLELDGYFMLVDYLEIPRLRQKALDFVKVELPKRLFRERGRFGQEELLFTVFGLLSALWTATAFALGLYLVWNEHTVIVLIYGLPRAVGLALKAAAGVAAGTKNLARQVSAA